MPAANVAPYLLSLNGKSFALRRWAGWESVSSLFRLDVIFESKDLDLSLEDLIGRPGQLTVRWRSAGQDAKDQQRSIIGLVSRAAQIGISEVRGKEARAIYRAEIVPRLWTTTLRRNCRIFQDKKTDEILLAVMKEHGFKAADVEKKIQGSFKKHVYCVQYRESDFQFISRLLEEEGICYFFDFTENKDILVLANYPKAHSPTEPEKEVPYHRPTGQATGQQIAYDCEFTERMVSGCAALEDFNFTTPQTELHSRETGEKFKHLEVYDFPGDYGVKADGQKLAKVRLEEASEEQKVLRGRSNCRFLTAGHTIEVKDHFRKELNQEYMVLQVSHEGDQSGSIDAAGGTQYANTFMAIPSKVPYRPPRTTPKPVVEGPQSAIVVGPSGEEIYTDEHGRVKVQFHWDREGQYNEKSSCWVRVSHAWAGGKWGAIYIPRVGQEVIVSFLEGDPDRPIITGRVYNAVTKPPYKLPAEKTKSTLKSDSSKGGGGFNEIRFEDKKGDEQLFIHAEKNEDIRIKNDCFEWIGNNRHLIVKKDQLEEVKSNRNEKVSSDHKEEIGKDRHLKVKGKEAKEVGGSHSLTVKGDVIEVFKANHSEQTTQNYYIKAMGVVIEAMQGITLKCGSNSVVIDQAGVTATGMKVTIDGKMTMISSGPGSPAQSGTAGSAVAPSAPKAPEEADKADPGEAAKYKSEQIKTKTGKYGEPQTTPHQPSEEDKEKKTWIEIELMDEEDNPVAGEKYRITLPDGKTVAEGTLDENGFAREEGIDPGTCQITFPNLDKEAWEKI